MSWMSCTDNGCEIHKNEKQGAGYVPKDPRSKSSAIRRREKSRIGLQYQIQPLRKGRCNKHIPDGVLFKRGMTNRSPYLNR